MAQLTSGSRGFPSKSSFPPIFVAVAFACIKGTTMQNYGKNMNTQNARCNKFIENNLGIAIRSYICIIYHHIYHIYLSQISNHF